MRCLISTIIRNRANHVDTWGEQLKLLVKFNPDIVFDLVVLENDSADGTKQKLLELEPKLKETFNKVEIEIKNFDWPYFGSIKAEKRVEYLAKARNRTLDAADKLGGLGVYDKVICIEPDILFDASAMNKIITSPFDIASACSVLPTGYGVPDWIYDSWATRVNPNDSEYFGPKVSQLPEYLFVASTFNCFCVYNATPFAEGLRFSGISPITKTWDCDTTNICFEFANHGYDKISMYNTKVVHKLS